jgi:diguanylate cyclase (GGDEF)-like protein
MMDIDHFKTINDELGHMVGNDALSSFSGVVKKSVRSIDTVCRYGGDEFIILLPELDPQHASLILERIRNKLEQTKITSPHLEKEKEFTLRFSAGIVFFPLDAKDLKELIWVADNALRRAKQEKKSKQ